MIKKPANPCPTIDTAQDAAILRHAENLNLCAVCVPQLKRYAIVEHPNYSKKEGQAEACPFFCDALFCAVCRFYFTRQIRPAQRLRPSARWPARQHLPCSLRRSGRSKSFQAPRALPLPRTSRRSRRRCLWRWFHRWFWCC